MEKQRQEAVALRLAGKTLAETRQATGLSAPTIIKAFKAFEQGGWPALRSARRGRKPGQGSALSAEQQAMLRGKLLHPPESGLWSREALVSDIQNSLGLEVSERAVARLLEHWGLECPQWQIRKPRGVRNPAALWYRHQYQPLKAWAEATQAALVRADCHAIPQWPGHIGLWFQTQHRKQLWWVTDHWPTEPWLIQALEALHQALGPAAICLRGLDLSRAQALNSWLQTQPDTHRLLTVPASIGR